MMIGAKFIKFSTAELGRDYSASNSPRTKILQIYPQSLAIFSKIK